MVTHRSRPLLSSDSGVWRGEALACRRQRSSLWVPETLSLRLTRCLIPEREGEFGMGLRNGHATMAF